MKSESKLLPFDDVTIGDLEKRRVFAVRTDRVRSQVSGMEMDVDRLEVPDWVNVVAIARGDDGEQKALLVRQWRFGCRDFSLELPAGVVDEGESPRDAALRELREETGHAPASDADVVELGTTWPNAAFMTNTMTTFFVPDAVPVGELALDETEELEVVVVPAHQLGDMVRTGEIRTASAVAALGMWWLHRSSEESAT